MESDKQKPEPGVASSVLLEQGVTADGLKRFIRVPLAEAGELLRKGKLSGTAADVRHLRSLIKAHRTSCI